VEENSIFLERLADFSYLAVWVQIFPLSLDRLLHPAHQTTAFRPLDPVPGLEAENVANCRKSVLVFIYFFGNFDAQEFVGYTMCECCPFSNF
jgi:hypothetical protein